MTTRTSGISRPQSWRAVFNFTTRDHIFCLSAAILLSGVSGIIKPGVAVLLGRIFNNFTAFGAGNIDRDELILEVSAACIALTVLGSVSWLLSGGYFVLWVIFGELQAKSARNKLFQGMIAKDIEWYDTRKNGIRALITRIQT